MLGLAGKNKFEEACAFFFLGPCLQVLIPGSLLYNKAATTPQEIKRKEGKRNTGTSTTRLRSDTVMVPGKVLYL